jgi:hypothetical protein
MTADLNRRSYRDGEKEVSKRETPMTRRYWERVRGTLLEEYLIVPSSPGVARRMIDAVIIEDSDHRIASRGESVSLDGHDIVIVQTKALRLGMYLLGQAFFSRELIKDRFAPRSIRTVALCVLLTTPSFARSPSVSVWRSL